MEDRRSPFVTVRIVLIENQIPSVQTVQRADAVDVSEVRHIRKDRLPFVGFDSLFIADADPAAGGFAVTMQLCPDVFGPVRGVRIVSCW